MNKSSEHPEWRAERMVRTQRNATRDQRGQAVVEIALLLPVLMVLLFGIVLAGFTFYAFIQVSNAAREGARAGSVYRITNTETGLSLEETVEHAIYDQDSGASALGFLSTTSPSFDVAGDVQITSFVQADGITPADSSDPRPSDQLTVQVTYRYTLPIVSLLVPMFPQPIVIVREVMMEIQ